MTAAGRRKAAALELGLADEELRATEMVLGEGLARVAMAMIYFAALHAARARLFGGLEPKTHAGVQHLFNVTFVRPGTYEPAVSQMLARLQKYREEADCARAFVVDAASAREELDTARRFVERVRAEVSAASAGW